MRDSEVVEFLFATASRPVLGPIHSPIRRVMDTLSVGVPLTFT